MGHDIDSPLISKNISWLHYLIEGLVRIKDPFKHFIQRILGKEMVGYVGERKNQIGKGEVIRAESYYNPEAWKDNGRKFVCSIQKAGPFCKSLAIMRGCSRTLEHRKG